MSEEKHHGHPRFYQILDEMAQLHSDKNHDYSGEDPLSNFKMCEKMGISAWEGILIRISDKWSRLLNFVKTKKFLVKTESVRDTLLDLAVYAILCIILLEEDKSDNIKR